LRRKKGPNLRSILFVCSANITRSPAAAALFEQLAGKSGERWEVASAGIKAVSGAAPNPVVAYILFQRNLQIGAHRSRPVTKKLLRKYYWIIGMERAHREAILATCPDVESRVFLLRELAHGEAVTEPDMPDPTGNEVVNYRELSRIFDEEMPLLFKVLRNRVSDLEWMKGRDKPDPD